MKRRRAKRGGGQSATPDLTPMIDVTFLLLVFFILCTRFAKLEENHRVDLPQDQGPDDNRDVPKEQITIYCNWDTAAKANNYVVAIGARGRIPVPNSYATLNDLVIFPNDSNSEIITKKARYKLVFNELVSAIQGYIERSGANIEKIEISFAANAAEGAKSGTAPWMFVSLGVDAATKINQLRKAEGQQELSLTFKYANALGS